MSALKKEDILKALKKVKDDQTGSDVVSSGMVATVVIRGSDVGFALEVAADQAMSKESLRQKCEKAVAMVKGVTKVTAVLTSQANNNIKRAPESEGSSVPGVKKIIGVASGKGGVGKSTVAVNLAASLARMGKKVGIVDADIYGPSVPKMLGIKGKPVVDKDKKMIPKYAHGIKSISIGYLVDEDEAAIWRGPMVIKALYQLFMGTKWEDIDYLIVDLPPGTGDIQLSFTKNFKVEGIVLVSTPQEVALADVKKAYNMFKKVHVPVIGVVENMSYFLDPVSQDKNYIFGKDGARDFAAKEGLKFLGAVPINPKIANAADNGRIEEEIFREITRQFIVTIDL